MQRPPWAALVAVAGACVAAGWAPPAPVAVTPYDSLDPRVAVDPGGTAVVTWRERTGGSVFQIWLTTNADGFFAAPVQLSQGGSIHCYSPCLAVDGGVIHLAWTSDQTSNNNFEIWYRRGMMGVWDPIRNASNTPIKSLRPNIAARDGIGPVLVWDEALYADDNYDTLFAEWSGAGFTPAMNISNTPGGAVYGSVNVNVAVSPNGDITAAWSDRISGAYRMNARRRTAGVWQPRQELSTVELGPVTPGIVAGPDNRVHVVYSSGDVIWYQQWNGSTWTTAATLPAGLANPLRPKVAIDADGFLHVVADCQNEIYYATNRGGPWSGWSNLSATTGTSSINADIACGGGRLAVVWQENSNGAGGTGVFNVWYTAMPVPATGPVGRIAGMITDQHGYPVAGALVSASPYQTASGEDGRYVINGVAVGTYAVSVSKAFFAGETRTGVVVRQDQTSAVDLRVTSLPPDAVVSLTVTPGALSNTLRWQTPASGNYAATMIRCRTDGFPADPADGELVADVPGPPSVAQTHQHAGLFAGRTYYYAAFAHNDRPEPDFAAGRTAAAMPRSPFDYDDDADVDLADFALFQLCYGGPNQPPPGIASCERADGDGDGDVDLADFGSFQRCFNGPNRPPVRDCAGGAE